MRFSIDVGSELELKLYQAVLLYRNDHGNRFMATVHGVVQKENNGAPLLGSGQLLSSRKKDGRQKGAAMKTLTAMRTRQVVKFALFLEEHPGFSPELIGDNTYVYGFRVGECLLSVDEMERLIDTPVEAHLALPQTRPPAMQSKRRLS